MLISYQNCVLLNHRQKMSHIKASISSNTDKNLVFSPMKHSIQLMHCLTCSKTSKIPDHARNHLSSTISHSRRLSCLSKRSLRELEKEKKEYDDVIAEFSNPLPLPFRRPLWLNKPLSVCTALLTLMMMTAESMSSKRPVLRFTVGIYFSSLIFNVLRMFFSIICALSSTNSSQTMAESAQNNQHTVRNTLI